MRTPVEDPMEGLQSARAQARDRGLQPLLTDEEFDAAWQEARAGQAPVNLWREWRKALSAWWPWWQRAVTRPFRLWWLSGPWWWRGRTVRIVVWQLTRVSKDGDAFHLLLEGQAVATDSWQEVSRATLTLNRRAAYQALCAWIEMKPLPSEGVGAYKITAMMEQAKEGGFPFWDDLWMHQGGVHVSERWQARP